MTLVSSDAFSNFAAVSNGFMTVTVPVTNSMQFYRLQTP